nr:hypothetical protein [uncultured Desulfobacter sp.]
MIDKTEILYIALSASGRRENLDEDSENINVSNKMQQAIRGRGATCPPSMKESEL